jgi:hypothetical protein
MLGESKPLLPYLGEVTNQASAFRKSAVQPTPSPPSRPVCPTIQRGLPCIHEPGPLPEDIKRASAPNGPGRRTGGDFPDTFKDGGAARTLNIARIGARRSDKGWRGSLGGDRARRASGPDDETDEGAEDRLGRDAHSSKQ